MIVTLQYGELLPEYDRAKKEYESWKIIKQSPSMTRGLSIQAQLIEIQVLFARTEIVNRLDECFDDHYSKTFLDTIFNEASAINEETVVFRFDTLIKIVRHAESTGSIETISQSGNNLSLIQCFVDWWRLLLHVVHFKIECMNSVIGDRLIGGDAIPESTLMEWFSELDWIIANNTSISINLA